MALEDRIREHIKQVEALQSDLIGRGATAEDLSRPEEMRKERAATIRDAVAKLERKKAAAVERYDAEIAALEAELRTVEAPSDLDLALRQGGAEAANKTAAATRRTKKQKRE